MTADLDLDVAFYGDEARLPAEQYRWLRQRLREAEAGWRAATERETQWMHLADEERGQVEEFGTDIEVRAAQLTARNAQLERVREAAAGWINGDDAEELLREALAAMEQHP